MTLHYNTADHLEGKMIEFGTHEFVYLPPQGAVEAKVAVSVSSEADLGQMLKTFEDYLRATGYELEGRTLTLAEWPPEYEYADLAGEYGGCMGDQPPYDPHVLFGTEDIESVKEQRDFYKTQMRTLINADD